MGAKAKPKTRAPNQIQSALGIIRAEVFAEAVRTGRTAPWHPHQFRRQACHTFGTMNAQIER